MAEGFVSVVGLKCAMQERFQYELVYGKLMVINVTRGCRRKTREHEDIRELVRQSVDCQKSLIPCPRMNPD